VTYGDHAHYMSNNTNLWQVSHTHSIVTADQFAYANPVKEPEMTAAEKVAKERREAREREWAEGLFDEFEGKFPAENDDGFVLRFKHHDSWGAAIRDGGKWNCRGHLYDDEEMIAWLIGRDVDPDDLEVWEP